MKAKNGWWKFLLLIAALVAMPGGYAVAQDKNRHQVILQISDDNVKSWQTTFNVVNNLTATYGRENVDIEVVAFGDGINALTFDSKAAGRIQGAAAQGAKILACENSMRRFELSKQDMAPDVDYVRAGVQRIVERQRQGWVLIRP
jgi:uncharacterized protein